MGVTALETVFMFFGTLAAGTSVRSAPTEINAPYATMAGWMKDIFTHALPSHISQKIYKT
jgi:hypothetical protein